MAVGSLILGIFSIVWALFGGWVSLSLSWLGIPAGAVAIVLAALARKNPEQKGMATAGLVCGIVGTALSAILFFACWNPALQLQNYGNQLLDELNGLMQ